MNIHIKFLLHAIHIFAKRLETKERKERKNLREIRTFQIIFFLFKQKFKKRYSHSLLKIFTIE